MRWIIALLTLVSPAAFADEGERRIAFAEGRYEEAASLADDIITPDTLAFAARSLLAEAMSAPDYSPPPDLILQAEQLSRRALTGAPNHIEARLQLAIALSLKARPLSTRQAMRTGYAEEAERLAYSVLNDDANNVYAHGFLAVWHLEVRRRGGVIGASMFGASVKNARHHYQAAVNASPGDAAIHWQYARALTALNPRKYRGEIDRALGLAQASAVETQLERVMQDRARSLQSVIETSERGEIQRVAAEML